MMSKTCDLLLDYFNGQLTSEQQEEFELHLLECEECQEELVELQQLTADLPYSSEAIDPPSGMKERVLSNIINGTNNSEPVDEQDAGKTEEDSRVTPINEWREPRKNKKKGWYRPLIAAVLTLSLVGNGAALIYFTDDEPDETEPTVKPENETSLDTIQKMLSLKPSEGIKSEAVAMMIEQNNKTNLVVQASDLPPLEGDETYQVWVLEEGKPYRAGTFVSNEKGNGAVSYIMNFEGKHNFDTIAITKEPNANSQKPKGEILLSSSI